MLSLLCLCFVEYSLLLVCFPNHFISPLQTTTMIVQYMILFRVSFWTPSLAPYSLWLSPILALLDFVFNNATRTCRSVLREVPFMVTNWQIVVVGGIMLFAECPMGLARWPIVDTRGYIALAGCTFRLWSMFSSSPLFSLFF